MALKIPRELLDELRRHGEATYPHESCGVLLGEFGGADERTVRSVVRCPNLHPGPRERRYRISSLDLVRVQREARQGGLAIVGFYHSHPDRPACWSSADLEEAHWTGCSCLITSVEAGRATVSRSYLLRGSSHAAQFVDETIEIADVDEAHRARA